MNERIRELAEQAGSTHKQSLGVYQFYSHELEKFAELIVKECMSLADLPNNASGQWDHLSSAEVIGKHFGVRE